MKEFDPTALSTIEVGQIHNVVLRELFHYWSAAAGDRQMPSRSDLDPADIPSLLPMVGLIDVVDRMRFRYRLIGTGMNSFFGRDFTGQWLEDAKDGPYRSFLSDLYRMVVQTATPLYSIGSFIYRERLRDDVQRLLLPLSDDNRTVDMIFFSTCFYAVPETGVTSGSRRADEIEDFMERARYRVIGLG